MKMESGRSNPSSDVGQKKEDKRQSKLTAKAFANKIESLQKERKVKVNQIKGVSKEIKGLMQNKDNATNIQSQLENLHVLFDDAGKLHDSVIPLLPQEEQEKQNVWFSSVHGHHHRFVDEVKEWLSDAQILTLRNTDISTFPQSLLPGVELQDAQNNEELFVSNHVEDDIRPSDSISNVASRESNKRSSVGRSSVSSTSSACIKAEADMAALMARQRLLKDKHVLEEQEEQLRKRKEKLDLEMEIAASAAKLNVLKASNTSRVSSAVRSRVDGMSSYLEREKGRVQALNVDAEIFVPVVAGQASLYTSVGGQLGQHLVDVRPKVRNVELQPQATLSYQLPGLDSKMKKSGTQSFNTGPYVEQDLSAPVMRSSTDQGRLISVLERQNEITSLLVEQQSLSLLPRRDIQFFDGDPLQYQAFIRAFEHSIEQKTHSARDCLYFLEQYTRGQPREMVRSCQHMPHESGYVEAKSLLQEHFGDPLKIASAYMEKVFTWPVVKSEDVKALQAYSFLLRACCNAMEGAESTHELDAPTNMQTVTKKLPYKLRDRWRDVVCDIQERFHRRANFRDIVGFIERQVKIANDPIFGDLSDSPAAVRKDVRHVKSQPSFKPKGSSFATTVTSVDEKVEAGTKRRIDTPVVKVCLFCGAGHTLDLCLLLEKKTHSEKMSFLKENGLCFGCLCIGHRSKDCRKRLSCKVCNLKHPTMLHIHRKEGEDGSVQVRGGAGATGGSALISVQSSGLTGAGEHDCTLSILPVQVKSKKGQETLVTYAFLDPGSSASFCTEGLMNRLNITGRKTDILLRTMGQEKVVGSNIVADLEVAGFGADSFIELPEMFTQKCMPVHQGNIPRQEDLVRWPHLEHLKIAEIDSGVDLLIGTNVPRALEPWEVVRSVNGGPYAVKTMLGWTVNGPLREECITDNCVEYDVTVNRISVAKLDELWEQQTKTDFPECAQDEQLGLSREDRHFMESVSESARLVDGHYSIGLPLKQGDLKMPNNRKVAEQRALSLKRRFNKDSASSDLDLLRFLWWPNGDHNQDLVDHRMVAHLFGAASSPSCASFALRKCAEDNRGQFSPKVIDTILRNFYVDDCLVSVGSEEEAVLLYQDLCAICAKGGFQLTKWVSNRRTVLAAVPREERSIEVKDLDLDSDILPMERALGVQWCVQEDVFKFKITLRDRPLTRRGILSVISSIYDPLGFLAPVVLSAKRILQRLCRSQLGWDDPLPVMVAQEWIAWLKELHQLENFRVERCLKPLVHCAFVMGKARIAPLKSVTIPLLELTAAVVAGRMDKLWRKELQLPLQNSVFWTDSTSVLKYIRNETVRFKTFVANRVSEILTLSSPSQWRYVNTLSNPADLASRGAKVGSFLKADAWVLGPKFLVEPESDWPENPDVSGKLSPEDPEVKTVVSVNAIQADEQTGLVMRFICYFSSWIKLKRMVCWLLRFKTLLLALSQRRKQLRAAFAQSGLSERQLEERLNEKMQMVKAQAAKGPLSVEEFHNAEIAIVRFCQEKRFTEERSILQKGESVKRTSNLYKLDPILEGGILRVGGRLSRAAMPVEAKHPAILAKDLHISDLVLRHIHQATGHGGRNHMLSKLRQRYWIPGASTAIRKTLSKCVVCRRLHAAPGRQRMADLPHDRVSPDEPPFTRAGVDYFGPFEVRRGRITVKRRFVARRGQVLELRSDNGTNFVGAERELREAIGKWNHAQINDVLLQKGIKWVFNPPLGSHHGGVWERLIRSVRKVLNSTLRAQNLDEEGLHTILCEAEAIINSRPITKASTDPNDLEALTPNHVLLLKSKPSLPPGVFQREDVYARRRWRQVQYIADLFWKRWVKEYLPQLQERQKWQSTRRNFIPGDLVVVVDESAPRNSWLTGRVVQAVPDKRGLVRQIRVKTKTSCLDRPITKVCLLQEAEEP
ncbi:uncharacterized protein LOC117805434 [Notolabrus celidotus]|uniref:uncharacterized protein LOC117805434 n=1 Tax=Notolabrus celidotus TaxID=1203425 RepID=UPI00148FF78E|nr:uncharacterized protein LOC117805434 [Notolabrus celidotus]